MIQTFKLRKRNIEYNQISYAAYNIHFLRYMNNAYDIQYINLTGNWNLGSEIDLYYIWKENI